MPAPLAYLLTWTTYGTWLRGDPRGWVKNHASGSDEYEPGNAGLRASDTDAIAGPTIFFDAPARRLIEGAIRGVCEQREWMLHAINVRSNHVHVVVTAPVPPEKAMTDFKAWSTRRLREAGVVAESGRVWTKHGSTRYLNSEASVVRAVEYVIHEQDRKGPGADASG